MFLSLGKKASTNLLWGEMDDKNTFCNMESRILGARVNMRILDTSMPAPKKKIPYKLEF